MSAVKATKFASMAANTPPKFEDNASREIVQGCVAWVTFNGDGTVAIQDSFNVSSVTDNATGNYTVNFTNNFANAEYAATAWVKYQTTSAPVGLCSGNSTSSKGVASFQALAGNTGGTLTDVLRVCLAFFGSTV